MYPIVFFFSYSWMFSLHDFLIVFIGVVVFPIFFCDIYSARIGVTSFDLSLVVILHNFKWLFNTKERFLCWLGKKVTYYFSVDTLLDGTTECMQWRKNLSEVVLVFSLPPANAPIAPYFQSKRLLPRCSQFTPPYHPFIRRYIMCAVDSMVK